ncbi:ABC-2 type transport system permease protein [Entomortierella parvispora]|uniref:ABC-2 type transport system permease protein n=1 Tax=Entomortierella parvispora TaxID=205924 RepID=A0A9P3HDL5_9FUNG|nr:ABC-2 type transport system permease protein [Entomortierella parvispora]
MSLRRLHSRNGSLSANPFDHAESSPNSNGEGRSIIIVNSDIMILPSGQQESQTEDDEDDDEETLSSSGHSSGRRSMAAALAPVPEPVPEPVPVPAKDPYLPSSSTMASYTLTTTPSSLQSAPSIVPEPFYAYQPPKDLVTSAPYSSLSTANATIPATTHRTVPGSPTSQYPDDTAPMYRSVSNEATRTQQPQPNLSFPAQPHDPIISNGQQPQLEPQLYQKQTQEAHARSSPRFSNDYSADLEMQDRARTSPKRTSSRERGSQALAGDASLSSSRTVPVSSQTNNGSSSDTTRAAKALAISEDLRNNKSVQERGPGRTNNQKQHHPTSHNDNNNDDDKSRNSKQRSSGFFAGLFSSGKNSRRRSGGVAALMGATSEPQSASGSKNDLIDPRSQLPHHHHHLRNDMVPEKGAGKSGVPGKNGEAPETDLFKYVGIMLDLPEDPTWREIGIKMLKVLAVMTVSYFALMALYFGAEFQSNNRMNNFNVLVVDLDLSMIGAQFVNFTQLSNGQPGQLNWSIQPYTTYPNLSVIMDAVNSGKYWGAVVIQPGASSTLNQAFVTPLPDYDPSKAFAFVYDGGRDPLVVKPYIVSTMYTQFLQFSKIFNPAWIKVALMTAEQYNITLSDLTLAPQVLGTPIAFEEFDLHPPTASIITSATTVAYIWIFLIAGGSTYLVAHMIQPLTKNATVVKTVVSLLGPLLGFLISLSMAYSLLLLAFGVPFSSGGQFLSLFGGMLILQCAVASMVIFLIYLIPVVFIPSVTITFVIMNVIAVFNPVELMPGFYRWVYAMPFLNAVQVARYVLMGSYDRLKYNIPILAIWVVIPLLLLPVAIRRQKRLASELQIEEQELEQLNHEQQQRRLKLQLEQDNDVANDDDERKGRAEQPEHTLEDDDDQDTLSDAAADVEHRGQRRGFSRSTRENQRTTSRNHEGLTINHSSRQQSHDNTRQRTRPSASSRSASYHRRHPSHDFSEGVSSDVADQTYYYQPPPPPLTSTKSRSQHRPPRNTTDTEPTAPSESLVFGRRTDKGRRGRGQDQMPNEVK